jgi:predicted TIM-barrel fold metal-dependent hydrolase
MRIDLHAHVFEPLDKLGNDSYTRAGVAAGLPAATLEELRRSMERFHTDAAVLSMPIDLADDDGRALARGMNEGLAEIVRSDPARFGAVATLPQRDVDASVAELAYALDTLALDGVALLTQTAGVYLGDASLEPLLEELDRRGAYVFVHPWYPPHETPLSAYGANWYDFPHETTRAVVSLVFSGALERFSNIRFQLSHLGGTLPIVSQRIAQFVDHAARVGSADHHRRAPAGLRTYLSRLWYDTAQAAHDELVYGYVSQLAGGDRIVFGTDWPVLHMIEGDDPAPGLATIPAEARARVDGENAAALVPRLVPAAS